MDAGTYSHHAYEAYRTLRETAHGKTCFQIKDPAKLKWMCRMIGISTNQSDSMMAEQLADLLDQEMAKGPGKPDVMVEAFAPQRRKEVWKKLNIYPSGVIHEEQNCVASCLTNVDGDYVSPCQKGIAVGTHNHLRVVGSIETGQELLQRFSVDDVFTGLMGDWLSIEPLLSTGTVDVFAMDENCSPPAIDQYAEKYQATLVSISTIIGVPGVSQHMPYNPQDADKMADGLIELAIENFKKRHGKITPTVPQKMQKAIAGFSTEAVLEALGNKLDPLVEVIKAGKIKGVVALASCSTLRNGPQGWNTVNLTKELIKKIYW